MLPLKRGQLKNTIGGEDVTRKEAADQFLGWSTMHHVVSINSP